MDAKLFEKFNQLSARIQVILDEKNALKEEIRYYQAENRELRQALQILNGEAGNGKPTAGKPEIAENNGRYAEKIAAIVKQLEGYVEEMDQCIAQMGN